MKWESWFRKFVAEASGWSDHLKFSIVKNPERMAEVVAKMKIVNSVEDTPAGRPVQRQGAFRSGMGSHLAWDCANRYSRSAEQGKDPCGAHKNWWRRSPITTKKGDGTCKTLNYRNSKYQQTECLAEDRNLFSCSVWGSSTGNLGSGYSHHTGQWTSLSPERRSWSSESSGGPESLSPLAFEECQSMSSCEKRGKQLHSWRRGKRRKLH